MAANAAPHSAKTLRALHTVGHSNWDFEPFAALLKNFQVDVVVDVRSSPHSARFPQFSQPGLEKLLEAQGLAYLHLGEELGGRPDDPEAYQSNGIVNYRARRKSYAFRSGIERLVKELEQRRVALMCAEEDPLECHRFLMICPELVTRGIHPLHIRRGSPPETQEAAENRLLVSTGFDSVAENTLFPELRAEALEKAYALQAEKFAFRVDPSAVERW